LARLVLRLTALAKIAAAVAGIGGIGAVYGKLKDAPTIGGIGTVMLFGGAVVYYFERFRMIKAGRAARAARTQEKLDEEG